MRNLCAVPSPLGWCSPPRTPRSARTAWISPKIIMSKSAGGGGEFDDSPTSFVGRPQATVLCGQSHLGQALGQVVNMLGASGIDAAGLGGTATHEDEHSHSNEGVRAPGGTER